MNQPAAFDQDPPAPPLDQILRELDALLAEEPPADEPALEDLLLARLGGAKAA